MCVLGFVITVSVLRSIRRVTSRAPRSSDVSLSIRRVLPLDPLSCIDFSLLVSRPRTVLWRAPVPTVLEATTKDGDGKRPEDPPEDSPGS